MKLWYIIVFVGLVLSHTCAKTQRRQRPSKNAWKQITIKKAANQTANAQGSCTNPAFKFSIPQKFEFALKIIKSVSGRDKVVIKTKKTKRQRYRILRRIGSVTNLNLTIKAPKKFVLISVPCSIKHFQAEYAIQRQRGRERGQSKQRCAIKNEALQKQCNERTCVLACKAPSYITKDTSEQFVQCGSKQWKKRANKLCIPRSNLQSLCFENEESSLDCPYTISELLRFYEIEERSAGDEIPVMPQAPTGLTSGRLQRSQRELQRQQFLALLCDVKEDGNHRYACANFGDDFKHACLVLRYHSSVCTSFVPI